MTKNILAFDLGAESGRAIVGRFDGDRITLDVVHRFPNGGIRLPDGLYWDVLRLYEETKSGVRAAVAKYGTIDSLGVDTWGVDFALLGKGDVLLGNPRHYRDPHTESIMDMAFAQVPKAEFFRQTGVQFMRFNSLFQLIAMRRDQSPILDQAESFLMMPDLFHFWFTGEKANESTNASTSQMYDPRTHQWANGLVEQFGLPSRILDRLIPAGTRLGTLAKSIAHELGIAPIPVIVPATHDTGSAVAGVPAQGEDWCYLSSGTWSLMGVELPRPIINDEVSRHNFTNEVGVGGSIRFLKNIMGLWLVQECKRAWQREGRDYSYDELMRMAEAATPLVSIIDPDDSSFMLPESMPAAIAEFCRRTGQPSPTEPGAVTRCALESLALRYRWTLDRLEDLTGRSIRVIHIVGGGSQNRLLNQFTSDACNRPVIAGPVEATALGNLMVQAMGLGLMGTLSEARGIIGRSVEMHRFEPVEPHRWLGISAEFEKLRSREAALSSKMRESG